MEDLSQQKKVTIMIAIMMAMFFAAINQTLVSTAMPKIIAILGGMNYYSWVITILHQPLLPYLSVNCRISMGESRLCLSVLYFSSSVHFSAGFPKIYSCYGNHYAVGID